jgi:hypothetical protein
VADSKDPEVDPLAVGMTVALAYLGYTHEAFRVTEEGVVYEGDPQGLRDDETICKAIDSLTRDVSAKGEMLSKGIVMESEV